MVEMKNEVITSLESRNAAKKKNGFKKFLRSIYGAGAAASVMATATASHVFAGGSGGSFGEDVTIKADGNANASELMGKIIGILLTITRFVGVALVIYGVYEVVMSFMQNQPEAKTKGIVMALAGVVMIGLKSIIKGIGLIN